MDSSTAANRAHVKAGYWFSTSELPVPNIRSSLFTHLYAGFAKVQYPTPPGGNLARDVIVFPDKNGNFERFAENVRSGTNNTVKALLSIGGEGNDESGAIYSVARDVENELRNSFISRSIRLAREHKYDGLDLCWLYPSTPKQWRSLATLFTAWRRAVDEEAGRNRNRPKLLLTATVCHRPPVIEENIRLFHAINDNLDWINVLAIDFYTPNFNSSPEETGPVHAWLHTIDNPIDKCGSAGIQDWIDKGVSAQKLVLGLPFYGYQWILQNPNNSGFFAPAHPASNTKPILYKNIPNILRNPGYAITYVPEYVATYSHNEEIWIGYDDKDSITDKVKKAIGKDNLRGYFAWNLAGDDNIWTLSTAASNAWPPREAHP